MMKNKEQQMTRFVKDQFKKNGEYVQYCLDPMPCAWDRRKFVARFKYVRGSKASFLAFLVKNFTVEEYFGRMDKGESPNDILESKGYVMPHIAKRLKAQGYPCTPEGFRQMIRNEVAKMDSKTQ